MVILHVIVIRILKKQHNVKQKPWGQFIKWFFFQNVF